MSICYFKDLFKISTGKKRKNVDDPVQYCPIGFNESN